MTPPLELLDRCLQLLGDEEKAQLDGVLISGDLTENGTADDYRNLRRELERRFPGIPLLVTLGNHDEKSAFREGWLGQAAFPSCPVDPAFSAILEELPVTAIICGHTHRHFQAEYAGIPYRTGASISFVGTDIDDYV